MSAASAPEPALKFRLFLAAWACVALAAGARAELRFKATTIQLKAEVGQEVLRGRFEFTNAGAGPVSIVEVKAACGCTSGIPEKRTYAAGEAGAISAAFTIGERTGHQAKTLIVRTDEKRGALYELTIVTDIPPFITLDPRLLLWHLNAAPDARQVRIAYPAGRFLKLTSVEDASGRFRASLMGPPGEPVSAVLIAPVSTGTPLLATMMFTFVGEDARVVQRSVFLRILGAEP
jgi:hypothetical protein